MYEKSKTFANYFHLKFCNFICLHLCVYQCARNKRVYLSQYDFEKTYAFQLSFNDEEAEVLKRA